MRYGIDVSMFIPLVHIESVKPDFVIIRSGEGSLRDAKTEYYAGQCRELNIPYGYYHVFRLSGTTSVADNIRSLEDAIQKSGRPSMGVWCDVETDDAYNNEAIREFCNHFEDEGIYSGIYIGINQLRTGKIDLPEFDKWIAYYGSDTGNINDFQDWEEEIISSYGTIWQYHGSNDSPDLNVTFVDDLSIYEGEPVNQDIEALKSLISTIKKLVDEIERRVTNL